MYNKKSLYLSMGVSSTMGYKILIPQPIAPSGINLLKESGFTIIENKDNSEEELKRVIVDCDAVYRVRCF